MIAEVLKEKQTISFEVFPPKKDGELESVYGVLDSLAELKPDFISVTYGAGGSNSKKTVDIASYIENTLHIHALAHMTCVGNKRAELLDTCKAFAEHKIRHVLALRGDRPKTMSDEQYESREFAHASDMIEFLKQNTDFQIAGACYPEKHSESLSLEADLGYLRLKQEQGAEFAISQLFFDNTFFYRFLEKAEKSGITIPICAGIMPITSANQIGTTISLSGSSVPKALSDIIANYSDHPDDMWKAGIDFAVAQIRDLKEHGVDGIHIYTMNKPKRAAEILKGIS